VKRLVGYARIAPREREGERPSLDIQRRGLENAAAAGGWELIRVEEDVRSGRSLRRPGLRAALAACRSGEADGVAVARLDRLTYSLPDLARLVSEAVQGGYTIVSLQPAVDIAADGGRAVGEVLAEAASWEPRGPSSTPAPVAERIRDLRAQGMTLQGICDTLNDDGVPTPRGGSEWRPTSLRAVLRT
jgi:DNA invertase Pin-like site-specific DNA recombinase